jgi:hypothetical protein
MSALYLAPQYGKAAFSDGELYFTYHLGQQAFYRSAQTLSQQELYMTHTTSQVTKQSKPRSYRDGTGGADISHFQNGHECKKSIKCFSRRKCVAISRTPWSTAPHYCIPY